MKRTRRTDYWKFSPKMGILWFFKIWATASYLVNCAAENDSVWKSNNQQVWSLNENQGVTKLAISNLHTVYTHSAVAITFVHFNTCHGTVFLQKKIGKISTRSIYYFELALHSSFVNSIKNKSVKNWNILGIIITIENLTVATKWKCGRLASHSLS